MTWQRPRPGSGAGADPSPEDATKTGQIRNHEPTGTEGDVVSTADQIIDQIDAALHDRSVSGDAMRWTPDLPSEPRGKSTLSVMGEGGEWQPVEGVISIVIHADTTAVQQRLREVQDSLRRMAEAVQPAAENAAKAMAAFACALQARPHTGEQVRPAWQSPYGPAQRRR